MMDRKGLFHTTGRNSGDVREPIKDDQMEWTTVLGCKTVLVVGQPPTHRFMGDGRWLDINITISPSRVYFAKYIFAVASNCPPGGQAGAFHDHQSMCDGPRGLTWDFGINSG